MDLSDALEEGSGTSSQLNTQQSGGPAWPGQPNQPAWPGQPNQPAWPGQPNQPAWPGQPSQPAWPGQPSQPAWPGQPSQPAWPGQPNQPALPGQNNPASYSGSPLTVPYDLALPKGCYDKMLITINGQFKPNAKMMTVNLCRGNDIAMHFNPRFNDHGKPAIVRNSLVQDRWGKEEREMKNFPFVQGGDFLLKILCTGTEFKVAVNDTHLLEFKHRIPELSTINHLSIYNDVTLKFVTVESLA